MSNVSLIDGHIDEPMFTDEQIKKALEICLTDLDCPNCPYVDLAEEKEWCDEKLLVGVFDLINRQKAENAELQLKNSELEAEIERLRKQLDYCENDGEYWESKYNDTKAEAIKEFEKKIFDLFPADKNYTTISRFTVKQITKEMVGECK